MPVVMLRMEEGYSCRMRQNDSPAGIEHFLCCVSALGVRDAIDDARRDLAASAYLQGTVADIDMSS